MGDHYRFDRLLRVGGVFLGALAVLILLLTLTMAFTPSTGPTSVLAASAADSPQVAERPAPAFQSGPQADFSATPRAGPAPLAVQFTDRSTGTIEAWLWSFGDGMTATVASPVYTYSVAGLYTVSLTVWSGGLSDTITKPAYIRVGAARPEVTFSGVTADSTDVAFNGGSELLGVAAVVGYGIYGQRIHAATGGTIGSPFALRTGSGQVDVHIAYHEAAGRYLAVWRNTSGGASDLYGQLVSSTGSLIGGNRLIQQGVRRLEVAASPVTAAFLVIWTESPTGTLRARFVSTDGSVGEAMTLAENVNADQTPALAYRPDGTALVAWAGNDGVIRARGLLGDGALLPMFSLSEAGAAEPAVVYEVSSGHFLVVWRQGSGTVMGRRADPDGGAGEPLTLGQMGVVARPFAAYDAATNQVWVIWGSNDYDDWEIYARRVTASGAEGERLPLVVNPGDEQGWNIAGAGPYGVYLSWYNASTIAAWCATRPAA